LNGKGCLQDESAAVRYLQRASDRSERDDLSVAGHQRNPEWNFSGEGGNATAQNMIGICLQNGDGVEKDLIRAAEYYRLSADQGHAGGQVNFGLCLENGDGVEKDLIRAAEYFRLSADQGDAVGQFDFGVCLEKGAGIRTDLVMAARYYKLAFDQGMTKAHDCYKRCLRL
jgi:TPR repeat protein